MYALCLQAAQRLVALRLQAAFRGRKQRLQLAAAKVGVTRLQAKLRQRHTQRKVTAAQTLLLEIEAQERTSRARQQRLQAFRREMELLDHVPPKDLARFAE